jgi:vitamin B12 transporter
MKNRFIRARASSPALSVLSLALAATVHAQGIEINPVVISASRTEQPLSQVLSAVSVITRAEIEKSQAPTLADLLQGEAGFEFSRNGGPGTTTSFFLRGQESINLVVLIDGVRAQVDQIGAIQTTDFPLQQIERVEILKGNVSALYGNSAIGGVINVVTRTNTSAPKPYGSASVGSFDTSKAFAGYGGAIDTFSFDFNAGWEKSNGFSSINPLQKTLANPDLDGYKKQFSSAKFEKRVSADTKLGIRFKYSSSDVDYDNGNSFSNAPSDLHNLKITNQAVSAYVRQVVDLDWVSTVNLSYADFKYDDALNGAPWPTTGYTNSYFRGKQHVANWSNTYQISEQTQSVFGVDISQDKFDGIGSQNAYALDRKSLGYFLGANHQMDKLNIQVNARRDEFQQLKINTSTKGDYSANTGLLGIGYQWTPRWRLTATASTGFSAPTVHALSANPAIRPENHQSQEVGATYQTDDLLMRAVFFKSHAKDAIIYTNAWTYINGDIDNKGWELTARTQVQGFSIKTSVTLQAPYDVEQNIPQARRAKEFGSFDVSRTYSGTEFGARLYAAGARRDGNASNAKILPGYATWNFFASRKIDRDWIARLKMENAFDKQYQLAYGYNTPGRGIYATLQYQPK